MKRDASEWLENLEELFPYRDCDLSSRFKLSTTHGCVTRREKINKYMFVDNIYTYVNLMFDIEDILILTCVIIS